jgi:3-phenylpropionate/trans-cinnamate dioxygenase ferredoxin reductase component
MSAASGAFSTDGHVVIVGASLAGLRAAEALRKGGFAGRLTLVGDEPYEPYDRPPLSKQVLAGRIRPESTWRASGCAWPTGRNSATTDC